MKLDFEELHSLNTCYNICWQVWQNERLTEVQHAMWHVYLGISRRGIQGVSVDLVPAEAFAW